MPLDAAGNPLFHLQESQRKHISKVLESTFFCLQSKWRSMKLRPSWSLDGSWAEKLGSTFLLRDGCRMLPLALCLKFRPHLWTRVWPCAALSCLSRASDLGGWRSETSACSGTEGVCRSAMAARCDSSTVTVPCSGTRIGVDRAPAQRGAPSHVSTDTSSSPPLNTLTLSGHTEQRPPSLLSPLLPQPNGQRGAEEETRGRNEDHSPTCGDGHLMETPASTSTHNHPFIYKHAV